MEALKYFFIVSLLNFCVYAEDPIIKTLTGKIKGQTISVEGIDLDVFLGIPYAKPPIGNLRFRRPEEIQPWNNTKDTKEYVSSCTQIVSNKYDNIDGAGLFKLNTNVSEDCLYLNIWAPAEARKSNLNLTTMIWIHGGSFISGSSTMNIYDGRWLAASENIIVASLNYRLGPFGFLSLNNEQAPGNMGLLDQSLAIKWIRNNIALFGGDPNKLTLFGQSAGGASVSLHVISPISRDLFKNAIMMSGTSTTDWAVVPIDRNIARAKEMAAYLKCSTGNTKKMLDCFLKADAEKLAIAQFYNLSTFLKFTFCPVIDNYFLTEKPNEILQNKSMKKDVLVGFVKNEGYSFLFLAYGKYFLSNGTVPINKPTGQKLIKKVLEPMPLNSLQVDSISYLYGSRVYPSSETEKYRYTLDHVVADTKFVCPSIEFAQKFSTHSNVYMYSFEFYSKLNPWPKWFGIMHGYDIAFVFTRVLSGGNYSEEDILLTKKVTSFFTNFSKSGNPNNGNCSDCSNDPWSKFTPKRSKYLVIDAKPNLETKENYMNNRCGFWTDLLPKLKTKVCSEPSGTQNIWTFQWRILAASISILFSLVMSRNTLI